MSSVCFPFYILKEQCAKYEFNFNQTIYEVFATEFSKNNLYFLKSLTIYIFNVFYT